MSIIRSFGVQTIASSSVAQPVFGSKLASNGSLAPDMFSGNVTPGSNPALSYLPITNTTGFRKGDRVVVGPSSAFQVPAIAYASGQQPLPALDCGFILAVTIGTPYDIVTVEGLQVNHATGEFFLLNEDAAEVWIVPVSTSGPTYLGAYSSTSPTDAGVFDVIPQLTSGLFYKHESRMGTIANQYKTSEYWVYGVAGDQFVARFAQSG